MWTLVGALVGYALGFVIVEFVAEIRFQRDMERIIRETELGTHEASARYRYRAP